MAVMSSSGAAVMKSKVIAALVACATLAWGSAHAEPDAAELPVQPQEIIILELHEMPTEQEQAILSTLLMQIIAALQAEGQNVEVQFVVSPQGERI
jgi:hypothetical protein